MKRILIIIILLIAVLRSTAQIYMTSYVYHEADSTFNIEYDSCYTILKAPERHNDSLVISWAPPHTYFPTTFVFKVHKCSVKETNRYHTLTNIRTEAAWYCVADLNGVPYNIVTYEHHRSFQLWITPLKFTRIHSVDGRRGFYISDEPPGKYYPNCLIEN